MEQQQVGRSVAACLALLQGAKGTYLIAGFLMPSRLAGSFSGR
jgi:hypothetical protein